MDAQALAPQTLALQPTPPDVVALSRQVLSQHARTFRLASLLLTDQQRDEAAILYAFCRLVDDTVDEAPDAALARERLEALRLELEGQRPARPLIAAFVALCTQRDIPLRAAHELIEGVASDLEEVLLPSDAQLLRYCYRVAGTVGIMMCGVIGVTQARALPFAIDLGVGMQLTNICRDVLEDSHRGRVYLPQARLRAAGTSQEALLRGDPDPQALASVVGDLLALADQYYASGHAGMRYIPLRPRMAIAAASRMYRAIGWRLRRHHCAVMEGRTVVPRWEKGLWLGRAMGWSLGASLGPEPRHQAQLHTHLAGLPGAAPP